MAMYVYRVGKRGIKAGFYLLCLAAVFVIAACTQLPVVVSPTPDHEGALAETTAVVTAETVITPTSVVTDTAVGAPAAVSVIATSEPTATETLAPTATNTVAISETVLVAPTSTEAAATEAPIAESAAFVLPTPTVRATTSMPTATPEPMRIARALNNINVRSGPGTNYPVIGALSADGSAEIVGRNAEGDWWQVAYNANATGWLYAPLVEVNGDITTVAIAENIPTPPPTATQAPPTLVATTPNTDDNASSAPTVALTVAPTSAPDAAPSSSGPVFRVIDKRLWDVYENGGSLFGDSVTCGEKRQLVVIVLDEQGNRLNGVAVQAEYGAREIFHTGSQGKGDGAVEFVLGGGQDVRILRNNDGTPANSEVATGLSTNPAAISFEQLINAQYCTDAQSCQRFVDAPGCFGHFSWTVTFQRQSE